MKGLATASLVMACAAVPALGLAADVSATASFGPVALDTRTAAGEVRAISSADEILPAAGDPTYCGAASGAYTVTMSRGSSVETLISASAPAVAAFQLLAGATTFTYTDSAGKTLVAVFTRASVPLGELGGVKLSGASAPKAGEALVASVEGVDDPAALAWVWQRGVAAYGTGVFSYSTVLSTSASYTPTAEDYETMIRVVATDGATAATNFVYFSRLPVVYLDGDVPTTKAQDYLQATLRLQGGESFSGGLYEGETEIKVRGNSTANMPKKPYKLKLGSKANLLGLGGKANKHWVLLANYLDQSLMRNTTAYRFSQNFGMANMKTTWVDVIVNGAYQGNYQLCEHIRIADDRISIFDWEDYGETVGKAALKDASAKAALAAIGVDDKGMFGENFSWLNTGLFSNDAGTADVSAVKGVMGNAIDGGFLFEFSHEYDELSKFTTRGGLKAMLNKPEFMYTNQDMMDFASNYIERCEAAWKSADGFNAAGEHYSELADVDSMVGFWLVNEIFGNNDASYKSRYAYMDRGGKLTFGPVWDFDWGAGGITVGTGATGWKVSQYSAGVGFYKEWLDDPWFCRKAFDAYWAVHGELEKLVADGGTLDAYRDYIAESGAAESNRWYKTQQSSYGANVRGFQKDSAMFKTYMTERIAWLDRQFANVETLMASVKTSSSAAPYTRDAARLAVGVADGADAETDDGLAVRAYGSAGVELSVKAAGAASVKAFAGGTLVGETGSSGTVTVPVSAYAGAPAVVSFVSYASSGAVVARSYVTVEKAMHEWEADVPETGAATVSIGGIALDTQKAAKGLVRTLSRGSEAPLPFALSGDFGRAGRPAAAADYQVRLSNAAGDSEWASGVGEAVKEWLPDVAGTNTFIMTLSDGSKLSAVFVATAAYVSGGAADDLDPAGGVSSVTVQLKSILLDTRLAAGATRKLADGGELLPFALSCNYGAEKFQGGAYSVRLSNAKGDSEWASGTGETVKEWTPDTAGENAFTLTTGDGGTLVAVFDVSVALASGGTAGELPEGGAAGADRTVAMQLKSIPLDTRTAAGAVREVADASEILPLAASASGFARPSEDGRWRIDLALGGVSVKVAAGRGEKAVEWLPPVEGRNELTHVAADGSTLSAVFAVAVAAADAALNEGELAAPEGGAEAEVAVYLLRQALDTRVAAGAVRTISTQEELDGILPIWHGNGASVSVAKDGGKAKALVSGAALEGTVEWKPAAAGTYAFVHSAGGKTETATFTIGAGLEYPGATALDADGGLSWLYVSADPSDASEWGYAGAAEYAAWPESVREAQTGDFTGVEVVDGGILLTFRARLAEAAGDTDLRSWAEASVASGKIAVMAARALGGEETPVALEVVAADALTVTLRAPLAAEGSAFYRLRIEE